MSDEHSTDDSDGFDLGSGLLDIETEGDVPDIVPDVPDVRPSYDGFLGPEDASDELIKAFWVLVVLLDIGFLAVTLGILVLVFQDRVYFGGGLLALGAFALARAGYRYYRFDRESFENGDESGDGESD